MQRPLKDKSKTTQPDAGPRSRWAGDRRRSKRAETRKLTTIHLSSTGGDGAADRLPACIVNFSATGLGLVVRRSLTPGQRFQLDVREGGVLTPLRYAVVRCEPWRGGCYLAGAVLIEVAAAAVRQPVTTSAQRVVARLRRMTGS